MPEVPLNARAEIKRLRDALYAVEQQRDHMHLVFAGWEECAPCEKADKECDGAFACDASKAWQKEARDGSRSRAEMAVDLLQAELTEATTKLGIVERRNVDLAEQLAERTRQVNGLIDSLSFDEKAVPA
ncbi:hypothetical protein OS965_02125 [Streptomyces sp. H27-G5]|uniref:hypothetical protein n=1 Tax=Streptomyces sp. H27-G5 TaxID=2996698 RepID=UPI00226F9A9D|nr:hypothetical protein [Streptomyces sp. H27-G5]MCY0916972.1 hypothetical protein [Streptomyces sp. H27-G5]